MLRGLVVALFCVTAIFDAPSHAATNTLSTDVSALAPPLATKPPCEIRYDKETGKWDVTINNDETPGKSFRKRWAFVDVGYLISQMLILTREHKLQNPKNILIPLIKKHIRNGDGEAEILLGGFEIDGIEETRDGDGEIAGFSLPVTKNGVIAHKLIYNFQSGDMSIPMKDGRNIFVAVENVYSDQVIKISEALPEDKPQSGLSSSTQRGRVNNINYEIRWVNPGAGEFKEDRDSISQNLIKFLEDPKKVETVLREIGSNITYKEIDAVNVQYLRASERVVFRINLSLTDEATRRTGPPAKKSIFTIAAKKMRTSDMGQVDAFRKLKGTGLAPEFGELFDDIYYEEWINGPTVNRVGVKRGLNSEEIRKITATWMKVMKHLSDGNSYTKYPIDMNPANIMYKNVSEDPEFAVVDIFERNRKPVTNNPTLFVHSIVKFYIYGKRFGVKSIIPNDIKSVLEGIYEGLDYDKIKTKAFLESALNLCSHKIHDAAVCSAVKEFLEQLKSDDTRMQDAAPNVGLTGISPESERIHAANFRDTLAYIQAQSPAQPLIIALGTSWMKGYERNDDGRSFRYLQGKELNELIISMRNYCESKGIAFIVDEDNQLSARISAEKSKGGRAGVRVVVLAGAGTVSSDEFAPLRNDEKGAFVVGVNDQELTAESYIRLVEMLSLALKLSMGLEVSQGANPIKIVKDDKLHIYILIPPPQPFNYEELRAIYEVQKFA